MSANKDKENSLEASYHIIYRIVTYSKNHTIAENLISPCVKDAVLRMLGEEHVRKMDTILFRTIQCLEEFRTYLTDVEATVTRTIKNKNFFAIQVNGSIDVAYFTVLLVNARYLKGSEFEENLFLCHLLSERTGREDIF